MPVAENTHLQKHWCALSGLVLFNNMTSNEKERWMVSQFWTAQIILLYTAEVDQK